MLTSAAAVADILTVQKCLSVITAFLQLTAYLFAPQAEVTDKKTVDYIVVGGGSAGCVIANRLSEDPKTTVLLIEAGGVPPMESDLPGLGAYLKNTQYDWNYTAQNVDFNFFKEDLPLLTLGKVLGGTSSINYMSYIRGAPADYDAWADLIKDDSWKYKNLLKFFKKSEHYYNIDNLSKENKKYHGTKGYMGVTKLNYTVSQLFMKGATEYGVGTTEDVNGDNIFGYTESMVTIAKNHRQSTAFSFLNKKFKRRTNLITYKYTTVTKILFDKDNNAIGVEATNNGNSFTFVANKEVILSAGAFNSPQLLMLSGIGPKKHLSDMKIDCISDLPVGVGLQDHTSAIITFNPAMPSVSMWTLS